MADRRAELEQKRQKLESMRQSRNELSKASSKGILTSESNNNLQQRNDKSDADQILEQLGISGLPRSNSGLELKAPTSMQSSTVSGVDTFITPSQSLMLPNSNDSSHKRKPLLAIAPVTTTVIQPKESITYSKEVQTLPTTPTANEVGQGDGRPILAYDGDDDDMPTHHSKFGSSPTEYDVGTSTVAALQTNGNGGVIPRLVDGEVAAVVGRQAQVAAPPARDLTDDERQQILVSERFQSFMSRASRVLERALTQPDVCIDYTRDLSAGKAASLSNEVFNLSTTFADDRFGSRHRLVTAVDFSTINPELALASYCDHGDSAIADPQGLVLIWNTKFSGAAPEFVFHAESPVRAACFAPFHPNLVVGATYSGQVVLWDTRLPRRTPANRTPLSSTAHTHPIYCLKVVGTQNANNLISISTDGRLCSWTLDMFSQPQETLDLAYKQKPVNAVCCAFLDNDPNNFVVGAEDGAMYTACRHGNKQGVLDQFDYGHQFNMTAVDTHHARGPIDFSNLVLTASNDWAVRLWSTRSTKTYIEQFREGQDSSTDVRWSPVHPALFASSDASGRLYLYDLNTNCEVPIAQVAVESGRSLIKRICWHPSGLFLAAGTESGLLHMYSINESTGIPRSDDWQLFNTSVRMMMASAEDRIHQTPIGQVPASLLSSIPSTGSSSGLGSGAPSSLGGSSSPAVQAPTSSVIPPHLLLPQATPALSSSHF